MNTLLPQRPVPPDGIERTALTAQPCVSLTDFMSSTPAKSQTPVPRRTTGIAQCTHMTVDRVYVSGVCHICRQTPSLGWLYRCNQDRQSNPSAATEALGPDAFTERIAQRAELETLGLSTSIINLIESHFYTPEQVEIVKTQKENLKRTIASLNLDHGTSKTSTPTSTPTPNKVSENAPPLSLSSTPRPPRQVTIDDLPKTPQNTPTRPRRESRRKFQVQSVCQFQCCHHCRPYYTQRACMSFESVIAGEVAPLTTSDLAILPVHDINVVRNIGLHTSPPSILRATDSFGELSQSVDLSNQGKYSSNGDGATPLKIDWLRSELARVRGAFDYGDYAEEPERGDSIRSLEPNAEILTKRNCSHSSATYTDREAPPPRTRDTRCGVDGEEFDMSLFQKKYSHILNMKKGQQQDAQDTQTAENDFGGEEVELDGGVALTEESVENHTPDIITEDVITQI